MDPALLQRRDLLPLDAPTIPEMPLCSDLSWLSPLSAQPQKSLALLAGAPAV
jgi:hypothetical protein